MTIELGFLAQREVVRFQISERKIKYFDRKWPQGIGFIPEDKDLIKHLLLNQRQFPMAQQIISWIKEANSGKNLEEYNACNTDEELAQIVTRDAKSKGLVEIK